MTEVTLRLDDATATKMKKAAEEAGLSPSKWVTELIQKRTSDRWPESFVRLAGAWKDFPTAEELRADQPEDVPREPF